MRRVAGSTLGRVWSEGFSSPERTKPINLGRHGFKTRDYTVYMISTFVLTLTDVNITVTF